jgi:nitrite reductase/ring-hydroxylating ferredoxin subunit/uncharacterized membrane protein
MVLGHGPSSSSTSTITGPVTRSVPGSLFAGTDVGHDSSMRSLPQLDRAVEQIERAKALDSPARLVKKAVDTALPNSTVRDALHGVWLGHPLHPALILVPLGSWMSASALDLLPGRRREAARTLVGIGVASALPTAAAGWADWSDLHPQQQRTGLVHAAANVVSIGLQFASWRSRRQGRQARGAALSLAALTVGGAAAYLGGHLAYRQGAMVNHAEEAPHILPEQWTPVGRLDELPDGEPTRRTLDGVPVFVLRRGQQVDVLYDLCSHLSGPLSEGELSGAGGEMCITCPWHGSTFRLRDGQVQRGPTTYPQPVLQVRIDPDGSVQARLREDD